MTSASSPGDTEAYIARAEAAAAVVADIPADTPSLPIRLVGVIGAGTMGGGIAMAVASAGLPVTVVETRADALDRGLATIRRNYENSVRRGRLTAEEAERRIGRIHGTLAFEELAACDLVVEAVFEDLDVKLQVFGRLDGVAKPGAILASNTSGLDLDRIAAATGRPEQVIGLHFFSPAHVMKLLEVVRGARTSPAVIATAMELARRIGKIAVLVGVCPGFVGNRMLYPRQLQAQALLRRGLMPWDVDRALNRFGFKMGPFQMADLAGLDIGWTRGQTEGDPIRNALCEMDRRGQKTGACYYDYDGERRPIPSDVVERVIAEHGAAASDRLDLTDEQIADALILPIINEAARILDEKIAQRASDIDLVWLYGYGWPRASGGPLRYANAIGLHRVVEMLGAIPGSFEPAPLLARLAASGGRF